MVTATRGVASWPERGDSAAPPAIRLGGARETIERLGLRLRKLDPNLRGIPEVVRRFADAGLDKAVAEEIFGDEGGSAMLALIRRVERLEEPQGS